MVGGFDFNYFYTPNPCLCECCGPRMTTMTATSGIQHKWTKKEIESRILKLARELTNASWFDRGDIRRQLRHWNEKLERFEQAEKEFDLRRK